jgi:hypothetical protein
MKKAIETDTRINQPSNIIYPVTGGILPIDGVFIPL